MLLCILGFVWVLWCLLPFHRVLCWMQLAATSSNKSGVSYLGFQLQCTTHCVFLFFWQGSKHHMLPGRPWMSTRPHKQRHGQRPFRRYSESPTTGADIVVFVLDFVLYAVDRQSKVAILPTMALG